MSLDFYDETPAGHQAVQRDRAARPYISILFECCRVYSRVYRRPGEPRYLGRCPRCLAQVEVRVGADGTTCRFFRAG